MNKPNKVGSDITVNIDPMKPFLDHIIRINDENKRLAILIEFTGGCVAGNTFYAYVPYLQHTLKSNDRGEVEYFLNANDPYNVIRIIV